MKRSLMVLLMLLGMCSFCYGSEADIDLQKKQSINLKSVGNARELGGYPVADGRKVKHGVLLRTADLNTISGEDIERLKNVYHLSVIADFRMSVEAAPKPDPVIDGVKYLNLSVINEETFNKKLEKKLDFEGDAVARLKYTVDSGIVSTNLYIEFLSDDAGKKAYREFFVELLNLQPEHSLLFHCTQGKDRTGCAAMLILSALGADEETIMSDYLLTNLFNAARIAEQRKMLLSHGLSEAEVDKYMIVFDEVNPKLMLTVLSWLKENYGSPVGYITKELGITEDEIGTLKAKFLD